MISPEAQRVSLSVGRGCFFKMEVRFETACTDGVDGRVVDRRGCQGGRRKERVEKTRRHLAVCFLRNRRSKNAARGGQTTHGGYQGRQVHTEAARQSN